MDFDGLKYCKKEGAREPDREQAKEQIFVDEVLDTIDETVSTDYQKGVPEVDVSRIFTVSGGTLRERNYFEQWKDAKRLAIVFVSELGKGLIPEEMVKITNASIALGYFIDIYGTKREYLDGDVIYLIQDVDHFGLELKNYYTKDKTQNNYQWIISNPCFEIWLYYHYERSTEQLEESRSMLPKCRSRWLKEKIPHLINGGINPKKTIDRISTAIINAKEHIAFDDDFPALFSTEMFIVAERIISIMKDELATLISRRAEIAKKQRELFERS
jgi:hypothetical protein